MKSCNISFSCCNNYPGKNFCPDCGANLTAVKSGNHCNGTVSWFSLSGCGIGCGSISFPLFSGGICCGSIAYPGYSGNFSCGSMGPLTLASGYLKSGSYNYPASPNNIPSGAIGSGHVCITGPASGSYSSGVLGGFRFGGGTYTPGIKTSPSNNQPGCDSIVSVRKTKNPFYVHGEY